jgi:hypothetical protein
MSTASLLMGITAKDATTALEGKFREANPLA